MNKRTKEKWIKRNEDNLRDLQDNIKRYNIRIIGVPEEEDKKIPWDNTWGDNREGNSHPSPRNPESPKQDKPKEKHPKTHINQTTKDQTQRENIKSSKGKATYNTQGDPHKVDLSKETLQDRRECRTYLKWWKRKTYNPRTYTQQGSHSDMKEKSNALQTSKSWEN